MPLKEKNVGYYKCSVINDYDFNNVVCVFVTNNNIQTTRLYNRPQARSQPARWGGGGGLNLDGWNTRRTTTPWTLSAWCHQFEKRPHSWTFTSTPPLDIARVTSFTYSKGGTKLLKGGTKLLKGGTKLLKGGTKLLKGGTKLLKGGTKLLKGGTKLLKGGTKLLKGGTKLLKGGTKLLKGGTKSLGWATGGGVVRPPRPPPPPGYGPGPTNRILTVFRGGSRICGKGGRSGYRERRRREGFWRVPFEDPLWNFKRGGGRAPPAAPPPWIR